MKTNKTKATDERVKNYLAAIGDKGRREDCEALITLMTNATGEQARMWGTSIVGFGTHHYKYESGREGDTCLVGFSSRKGDISIYGLGDAAREGDLLPSLGKHKMGKGCLYVRRLSDIDREVLKQLIATSLAERK